MDPICPRTSPEIYTPSGDYPETSGDNTQRIVDAIKGITKGDRSQFVEDRINRHTELHNETIGYQQKVLDQCASCCYSSETQTADILGKLIIPMMDRITKLEDHYTELCMTCAQHLISRLTPLLQRTIEYTGDYGEIEQVFETTPPEEDDEEDNDTPIVIDVPDLALPKLVRNPPKPNDRPVKDDIALIDDEKPRGKIPVDLPRAGGLEPRAPPIPPKCPECCFDFSFINAVVSTTTLTPLFRFLLQQFFRPKEDDKEKKQYGEVDIKIPNLASGLNSLTEQDVTAMVETSQSTIDREVYEEPSEELGVTAADV